MFFGYFRASATINLKLEVRSVCSHSLRILVRRNLCPEYVRRLADDTPRLTQLTKVQVETKNLLSQLVVSLFKRWEKEKTVQPSGSGVLLIWMEIRFECVVPENIHTSLMEGFLVWTLPPPFHNHINYVDLCCCFCDIGCSWNFAKSLAIAPRSKCLYFVSLLSSFTSLGPLLFLGRRKV